MTISLNLDLPRLRKRAQAETAKVAHVATDAAQGIGGIRLPQVDVGETLKTARKAIGDVRHTLVEGTDQVTKGAEQVAARASDLGHGVRGAVDDLRTLRITRQQTRRDPWPGLALVGGISAGVAAMFLFDPRDGARRRALLRDKLGRWTRIASHRARGTAVDLRNKSQGLIHDVRTAIPVRAEQAAEEAQGAGRPDWASQEPVGVGVGAGDYGELSEQPYAPNGRDNI
jgi:gas vesicle protein